MIIAFPQATSRTDPTFLGMRMTHRANSTEARWDGLSSFLGAAAGSVSSSIDNPRLVHRTEDTFSLNKSWYDLVIAF